jgi:N-methylhydantoinase B
MTNTLNTPVEVLELNYPLRIEQYAIRYDSGGTGKFRGGDGVVRTYRFLEGADVSLLTERRTNPPWGLEGGQPGSCGINELDGQALSGKVQFQATTGQALTIETPGGGGYGTSPALKS